MPFDVPPPPLDNPIYLNHRRWMLRALALAETAGNAGEVPVGAVIVGPGDEVIAEAGNGRERDCDPTAHAPCPATSGTDSREVVNPLDFTPLHCLRGDERH